MLNKQCISSQHLRVLLNARIISPLTKHLFAAAIAVFGAACEAPLPEVRNVNAERFDGGGLKVISYNMLHPGPFGRWSEYDGDADRTMDARFELLTTTIVAARPDVVILQEGSDTGPGRYGNSVWNLVDAVNARLADDDISYNAAFSISNGDPIGLINFHDGNGILSRYEITDVERTIFRDQARSVIRQSRSALRVSLSGNDGNVDIIGLHLEGDIAADNIGELIADTLPNRTAPNPIIVAGDLNQTPESAAVTKMTNAGFADVWGLSHPAKDGFTSGRQSLHDPQQSQTKRIDFMFASPEIAVVSSELFLNDPIDTGESWVYGSDHTGLSATLNFGAD